MKGRSRDREVEVDEDGGVRRVLESTGPVNRNKAAWLLGGAAGAAWAGGLRVGQVRRSASQTGCVQVDAGGSGDLRHASAPGLVCVCLSKPEEQ